MEREQLIYMIQELETELFYESDEKKKSDLLAEIKNCQRDLKYAAWAQNKKSKTKNCTMKIKKAISLAKAYGWATDVEYFDYIIDSKINGQLSQAAELYKQMDRDSKATFRNYLVSADIAISVKVELLGLLLCD